MKQIVADLLQRFTKEAKVTMAGTRESILVISERVNRKTQTLRLHWQAATITDHIEKVYRTAGQTLCNLVAPAGHFPDTPMTRRTEMNAPLLEAASAVRLLKQELTHIEGSIRDLEVEGLHEDIIKIQRDLASREAGLSRITVAPGSSAVGLSLAQLNLPATTRVAALLRGPALLSPTAEAPIRVGDIVILIGPQAELQIAASHFVGRSRGDSIRAAEK